MTLHGLDASINTGFAALNTTRAVVDQADLTNPRENQLRAALLQVRGWPNTALFTRLPTDVTWQRATIEKDELRGLLYGNFAPSDEWPTLSGGTRRVSDGATNAPMSTSPLARNIRALAGRVGRGERFRPLILVTDEQLRRLVLMDGNSRATAYVIHIDHVADDIEVIVGVSSQIANWHFW